MSKEQDRALDALYAELPRIDCTGQCWEFCGPIGMTRAEWRRIQRASGTEPSVGGSPEGPMTCSLLAERRCSVYRLRPLICRLYGLVEPLACPHGCRPVGGFLTEAQSRDLLRRVSAIGGPTRYSVPAGVGGPAGEV